MTKKVLITGGAGFVGYEWIVEFEEQVSEIFV
jgi:nucleoside-diphosphate-sugar epimerase